MNEILRRAILGAGLDETDVAARLEVDPKTVRRWLEGRVPYSRHRWALADLLKLDETALWPELRVSQFRPDGLVTVYPHRSSITPERWRNLFASAKHEIIILDYSSLFLVNDAEILCIFVEKARSGVKVRIALSDPNGQQLSDARLINEIRSALDLYRSLPQVIGIEIRLHQVALYSSIYRADSELLCNQHAYGIPDWQCPVWYLQCQGNNELISTYLDSFEQIWDTSHPYT